MVTAVRRFRESEEAVSPVIATILLVSFSVILAAMLYLWVSNLVEFQKTSSPQIEATVEEQGDYYYVTVVDISERATVVDMEFRIVDETGIQREWGRSRALDSDDVYGRLFIDEDRNAEVTPGDFFVLPKDLDTTNAEPELVDGCTVILVYKASNAVSLSIQLY